MSHDVLVTSEARAKLYRHRLTKTLSKLIRNHLVLAISCRQVMSLANQVISLWISPTAGYSDFIVYSLYWVNSKELEMTGMVIQLFE